MTPTAGRAPVMVACTEDLVSSNAPVADRMPEQIDNCSNPKDITYHGRHLQIRASKLAQGSENLWWL